VVEQAVKEAVAAGYDPEVIDLISLKPFDQSAITVRFFKRVFLVCSPFSRPLQNSVRKTHRVIIVEECMRSGGIGASVSSWISENLLEELDHEVIRLSSQDVPTAYAKLLEDGACHLFPPSKY
jgi:pyruvate dehydrogenase E1 component beta subunit